ncbi:kinase-like domain-containing protein [Pyrenochaeta sp. MPI-SDFR-AT-0127]|nr:kinase-like domain-containing protein [Pyrenochaeta sp. MPI-SDFR-AT-0127]
MEPTFHDDLLPNYSESGLARLITASPRLAPASSIFLLSSTLISKHYEPTLVEDMVKATEVARQLGILAPCIKRIITYEGNTYCIMERVRGNALEEMWIKLSWFTTIKLALQLCHSVSLLRSVTSSTAGSVASGECRSFWLEDRYGLPARSTPEYISSFFQFWVNFTSIRKAKEAASDVSKQTKTDVLSVAPTFVLTHHDLAPRNILLDLSGKLWLLDWDYAGFYPTYFEYAAMQNFYKPQTWSFYTRLRWNLFSWIAVGRSEKEARVLRHIRSKFTRFAAGRRFELMLKGGPSRRPVS